MNSNQNPCTENAAFWHFIRKLQITRKNNKLVLTSVERTNLCNYMNGQPYNKQAIRKFI